MHRHDPCVFAAFLVSFICGFAPAAWCQPPDTPVPPVLRFAGTVPAVAGPVTLVFSLYAEQSGGAAVWQEVQRVEADGQGRYAVVLGSTIPDGLPPTAFASGRVRWLGVAPDGQAELPRVALVSVPYAMKAGDAETVGGKPLSAFVLAGDRTGVGADGLTYVDTRVLQNALNGGALQQQSAGSANYIGMFQDATTIVNSTIYQGVPPSGGVGIGIGTAAPQAPFHAVASTTPGAFFDVYSGAGVLGALPVVHRAARGTAGAPSAVQTDDILGGLAVRAYGATKFSGGRGQVMFKAAENWTDGANGTYLSFSTEPLGASTTAVERMRITADGDVGVGTAVPEFPIDVRKLRSGTAARFGVGSGPPLFLLSGPAGIGFNMYFDAGYRYGVTGTGGYMSFNTDVAGGFSFATAPAGALNAVAATSPKLVITNSGLVGIGTSTPSAHLNVIGTTAEAAGSFGSVVTNGTGVEGRANVGTNAWGVYGVSGDGVGVMGRSVSTTGFAGRFENLGSGPALGASVNSAEVLRVDDAGVHAGAGMTPTPVAHGVFDASSGARLSGSTNITCSWVAAHVRYVCAISGETFLYTSYTVSVTPTLPLVPTVDSAGGSMLVQFFNLAGAAVKPSSGAFNVVVFKQ